MTVPLPSLRRNRTDPGGSQARAVGQGTVEVRNYDGELIRRVTPEKANQLVLGGIADQLSHCLRIKLGIRCLPPRLDKVSPRPDLEELRRRKPEAYAEIWAGNRNATA